MLHAHCMGAHGHWFWVVPVIFMILMMVCVFRRIRHARSWRWDTAGRAGRVPFGCCSPRRDWTGYGSAEAADQILDRRYAKGEITKEQYEQMKRDIDSSRTRSESGDES